MEARYLKDVKSTYLFTSTFAATEGVVVSGRLPVAVSQLLKLILFQMALAEVVRCLADAAILAREAFSVSVHYL
jgi:hypothetical protein